MKKRILAMLMAMTMIISLIPMTAMADECDHAYKLVSPMLGTHQYECEKCGDAYGVGLCKNADSDYDGTCDLCKTYYKHDCDEKGLEPGTAAKHNVICSQCGAIQFSEQHDYAGFVAVNETKHVKSCACGARQTTRFSHKDNNGDNKCDNCGYTDHKCVYDAGSKYLEDNTHKTFCACGEYMVLNCLDYDGDTYCDSCSHQKYIHTCEGGKWTSNNDGTHSSKCSCGSVMDGPNPCYTVNGMFCFMCGYNMHDCDYDAGTTSNEDGTHNVNCACGKFVTIGCLDSNGDGDCDSCGYKKYDHTCEGGKWISNNDGTHSSKCACGSVMDGPNPCQTLNGKTCYMCGYNMHACDYEAGVTSNGDGTHNINCECGNFVAFSCLDSDGDGDCDSCGFKKYIHVCEGGKWTSNNNGTHSSKCTCGLVMDGPHPCQTINGKACYMCGYVMVCTHPDEKLTKDYAEATCTEGGHSVVTCECGAIVHEEKWDMLGHEKLEKKEDATCTQDGKYHVVCTRCNEILREEVIPAGHKFEKAKCTVCGEIDADCEHPEELLTKDYQAATCTEGGHSVVTCACGAVVHEEKWGALEHMKLEKIEPATCEKEGLLHVVCRRCNELLLEKVLAVKDHVKLDKSYPATCTEDGLEHVVCTACNKILRDEVIPAGHKFDGTFCTVCGMECNHENGVEKETPATCTDSGCHSFWCPDCNFEKMEELPALGHVKKDKSYPATCTADGLEHVVCTTCNEVLRNNVIPATGHKNKDGKCTVCGTVDSSYVAPPVPDTPVSPDTPTTPEAPDTPAITPKPDDTACAHGNVSTVTCPATCTTPGYKLVTCLDCDAVVTRETLAKKGHTETTAVQSATCTKNGAEAVTCTTCNALIRHTVLTATGHHYANGLCSKCGAADPNKYTSDFNEYFIVGGTAY